VDFITIRAPQLKRHLNVVGNRLPIKERVFLRYVPLEALEPLFVVPLVFDLEFQVLSFVLLEFGELVLIPPLELPQLPLLDLFDAFVIELVLFLFGFIVEDLLQLEEFMVFLFLDDLLYFPLIVVRLGLKEGRGAKGTHV
jgi:hypothetical protein